MIVTGNHFNKNGGNGGIFMTGPDEDTIMNCTITDNYVSTSEWGIWLIRNDYIVRNNSVTDCGYGMLLDSGRDSMLSGNVMYDNTMNFGVDGDGIEYYFHEVDTTNTVDGKPVYYLVEEEDIIINSTIGAGTVYIIACEDIVVMDQVLEWNEHGLFIIASDDVRAYNVTATMNDNGISISKSADVYIGECSAQENALNGFRIRESERVLVVGVDAVMNAAGTSGTGISVEECMAVLLIDVNANQNNFAGIDVEDSNEVYLASSHIDSNGAAGVILGGDTLMVRECRIRDNEGPGIDMLDSTNITVLNNYFSNDVNIDLSPGTVKGVWNQEKSAGPNIVDGPFIGGNYWAKPDGTGWSQITPDRGDGFCNAPFVIDADNVDNLPLHTRTTPPFYADFTGEPVEGYAPLTVQFTDTSDGEPFRWYYRFGDGSTSSSQNPVHTYRSPGTYTVSLSIMKMENSRVITTITERIGYITVKETPGQELIAQFNVRPTTGEAPLTVSFTDYSSGNPNGYRYSFGDLGTSTRPNPVHIYRRPGTYSVQLTVWSTTSGRLQSNTTICQDCITVT
jgi:parallel beta-helix repeat protein